jgi:hypothetical protein
LSRLTARALHVRLRVRDEAQRGTCRLLLRAQRDPGSLYVGSMDDHEPVWVRRHRDRVQWIAGYKTLCRPGGVNGFVVTDAFAMTTPTTFSVRRTRTPGGPLAYQSAHSGVAPGRHLARPAQDIFASMEITGTFTGNQAAGTFHIHASNVDVVTFRVTECDTGQRSWEATAE